MYKNSNQRFREIVKVLVKYGFGYFIDSKIKKKEPSPENLRKVFEELGPTFIKIGQIISTRTDLLPEEYTLELKKLQDEALPESFKDIEMVFFSEFNKPIKEVFKYFDEVPMASASIAQVHKAILKDGRQVIVKIQRPKIKEKMALDISLLDRVLKLAKGKITISFINPSDALQEIWSSTQKELDFTLEMTNTIKFKELNQDVACVYVPYVVESICSEKVLTLELIDGLKVDNISALKENYYDLSDISTKLALSFVKQVFNDGFFHGDPHPGNILIRDNKICFIDFGIVGDLNLPLKEALNDALTAIVLHDINKLIGVFLSIGIRNGYVDRNALYEDMEYLFQNYLNTSLAHLNLALMLEEIITLTTKHHIRLPKELTLVMKSFVILEGVITNLAPEIKILDIAIPYVKSNNEFIPKLSKDELLLKTYSLFSNLYKAPGKVVELSDSLLNGRAKIQIEHKNLGGPLNQLNKMVNRLVFALVVSAMIIGSAWLVASNTGPQIRGVSFMGVAGFALSAVMGLWLLISIIRSGMT